MRTPQVLVACVLVVSACKNNKGWSEAFPAEDEGAQSGVWGSAPDDVYVVGGFPDQGVVHHYDGSAWSKVDIPTAPLMVWVFGFGPDDIWAVGEQGGVLHKTSAGWGVVDVGTTEALWGVWGSAPNDLWMVGGDVNAGDPLLIHYDGTTFTPVALDPTQNDRGARSMFKVFGIDGRTFAVGQNGLMVEYDGTQWLQLAAGADADQDFVSLWGTSSTDLVAVGGRSGARLASFAGDRWETTAPSGFPGMNAVSVSADGVWVGGQSGFVGAWTDEGIVKEESPIDTSYDLHAMWHDGDGVLYGVGGQFREPYAGIAWVRETR